MPFKRAISKFQLKQDQLYLLEDTVHHSYLNSTYGLVRELCFVFALRISPLTVTRSCQ